MSFALIRLSILGGALILIAGCGGSGSGGSGGGNGSTNVTFTITGGTPTDVATRVGSGAFTAATLTSGSLTLSLPSGTTNFAVAFVCPPEAFTTVLPAPPTLTTEIVYEASTLDGTSYSESCTSSGFSTSSGSLTMSVDASAVPGASYLEAFAQQNGTAGIGSATYDNPSGPSGSFSLLAPTGSNQVEVVAYNSLPNFINNVVAAKNFSNQTVPGALNGGNTVVLGAADETTPEPLTYQNVLSGYGAPSTEVSYNLGGSGEFTIAESATSEYPALPSGAVENGDYYVFVASSSIASTSNSSGGQVYVYTASATGGPESITFPAAWTYGGPTPAALPSFDLSYAGFSGKTDVFDWASISWSGSSTVEYLVQVVATGNYLNGSTTLAIPDLSGGTGFLSAPASGTDVIWEADISQGNFPSLQPLPLNGTVKAVSTLGTYVVP